MTAEEMFNKLGYKKTDKTENYFVYDDKTAFIDSSYNAYKRIFFDLQDHTVCCELIDDMGTHICDLWADEIKVINKQIEELGW